MCLYPSVRLLLKVDLKILLPQHSKSVALTLWASQTVWICHSAPVCDSILWVNDAWGQSQSGALYGETWHSCKLLLSKDHTLEDKAESSLCAPRWRWYSIDRELCFELCVHVNNRTSIVSWFSKCGMGTKCGTWAFLVVLSNFVPEFFFRLVCQGVGITL